MRLLPEPVYVRAFIRDICRVMGADPKPVTDAFARDFAPEAPAAQAPAAADAVPARKMEKEVEFHASPRKKGFRVFLAFAVVIVLIGAVWGGWREGILSKLGGDNTEAAQVQMQEASAEPRRFSARVLPRTRCRRTRLLRRTRMARRPRLTLRLLLPWLRARLPRLRPPRRPRRLLTRQLLPPAPAT